MRFLRSTVLLAALAIASPALAQTNPGTSPLSIAKGGTGGTTASAARTSLGLTATATAAAGQLPGEPTTGSASAGNVGELITNTGSAVSLVTATPKDITTVSLSAGDWFCWGSVSFTAGGTPTTSFMSGWISTTANTEPSFPNGGGYVLTRPNLTGGGNQALSIGNIRLSLSGTTTVSLGMNQAFSGGTSTGNGFIACERRR